MSEATMTLSQLVERIRGEGEDLGVLTDKVKAWVKEGLIAPVGSKNPGTGHRRDFSQSALIDAAVLHTLTAQVGMAATRARGFAELFKHSHRFFRQPADQDRRFVAVAIDGRGAEIGTAGAKGLAGLLAGSPHAAHAVIDLQKLFKRLEQTGD